VAEVEEKHEERYNILAGLLESGKMFESNVIVPMQNEDRELVNRLISENKRVLKRLGEADERKK
jgi:hypothetical protein